MRYGGSILMLRFLYHECKTQIQCSLILQPYVSSSQSPTSTSPQPSYSPQPPAYPQNIPASYSPTSNPANRTSSISPISSSPYDNVSKSLIFQLFLMIRKKGQCILISLNLSIIVSALQATDSICLYVIKKIL